MLKKDWAILLHFIYTCYLLPVTIYLITKLSVTDNFSACREYLLKTAYHFLLLLVGFDTLTYRKDYDRSPILVGHQLSLSDLTLISDREGIDNPFIALVARFLFVCAGTRDLRVASYWIDTLVLKN